MNSFSYNGFTFTPVGAINADSKKSSIAFMDNALNISNYNISGFYKAAFSVCRNSDEQYYTNICDIFFCHNTGKYYTPCQNELSEWTTLPEDIIRKVELSGNAVRCYAF